MIKSLKIDGYRGFKHFEMSGLGRINLLVGANNSGKTSLLEALYILVTEGNPFKLCDILDRREEYLPKDIETKPEQRVSGLLQHYSDSRRYREFDIQHLFYGHKLEIETKFSIHTTERSISYNITKPENMLEDMLLFPTDDDDPISNSQLGLHLKGNPPPIIDIILLSQNKGLTRQLLNFSMAKSKKQHSVINNTQYIETNSISSYKLYTWWDKITATEAEIAITNALKLLEPKIERITTVSSGNFLVKLSDVTDPVPIGTLGEGIRRMLTLAIAVNRSKGGFLLIDEIDTGLHYSTLEKMWKLVAKTAEEMNVQVFATTHSYDCVKSLAAICQAENDENSNVSIQRMEPDRDRSVPYTEAEIKMASERNIEVR